MKKIIFISITFILLLSSCSKETLTGDVTFWQLASDDLGLTVVELNGLQETITMDYNVVPECGDVGCADFNDLAVGTYNYTATDGTNTWNSSVTITEGCLTLRLTP